MQKIDLQNVVWREGENYVAMCLNTYISSFGDTREDALESLQEALELYFQDESMSNLNEVAQPDIVNFSLQHA
jgi:predicted RNase H-like HicB family nuclease